MISSKTLLSALLAVPVVLAAPHMTLTLRGAPQSYSGPASSFPAMSEWADFNTIVNICPVNLLSSKSPANHVQQLNNYTPAMTAAGSTQGDVTNIGAAAQSVASSQGIDSRVILSLIIQESTGYVGVATTTNVDGQGTGGLMQTSGCQGYPGQNGLTAVCFLGLNLNFMSFRSLEG